MTQSGQIRNTRSESGFKSRFQLSFIEKRDLKSGKKYESVKNKTMKNNMLGNFFGKETI